MRGVPPPRFQKMSAVIFAHDDIRAMLKACMYAKEAGTKSRGSFAMRRPTAKRDRVIILVLLDTGIRASELCHMKIENCVL